MTECVDRKRKKLEVRRTHLHGWASTDESVSSGIISVHFYGIDLHSSEGMGKEGKRGKRVSTV